MTDNIEDLAQERRRRQGKPPLRLDPKAPFDVARIFLKARYTDHNGLRLLHHHRDQFYGYGAGCYALIAEGTLKAELYEFLKEAWRDTRTGEPFDPNRRVIGDVIDGLRGACHLSPEIAAPAWLGEAPTDLAASDILSCRNTLLHLPTRSRLPHTPEFFNLHMVDFDYDETATASRWLKFLAEVLPGPLDREASGTDCETIEQLQQTFGYLLTPDTSQQKAFLLLGPTRSGKGTIARIMTLLVGRRNVVSPGLTGLSATFGLEQMLDKQGALFSDTRLTKRADQGPIIEFILKVTGKDQITIQRKFLPAVSGTLPLRLVVLANELPAFLDPTGVLASRFLLYRFRQSFYGREDRGLTAKLAAEVSGILNWALDGLDRLRETGRFGQPASGVEELWHWQDRVNPVGRFVRTGCVLDPSAEVKRDTLFLAYSDWNEAKKAGGPTLLEAFGRKLKAVFPITEYRPWADPPAPRPRYYRGIREMSHKEREAAEDSE